MPKLLTTPFAIDAEPEMRTDIQNTTGASPNSATYSVGFPPITMQSLASGGLPPKGADFNGLLYDITGNIVFQTQGNAYPYNAAYATEIGGYPLNARIALDNGDIVRSTIASNTNNPNTDMTGWVKVGDSTQLNYSLLQNSINRTIYNKLYESWSIKDFGAIGDGTLHTVQEWIDSGKFSNLTAVQVVFPFVTSTTDSIDWVALQGAIKALPLNTADVGVLSPKGFANGGCVLVPRGRYYINKKVTMQRGLRLIGESRESSQLISFIGGDSVLQYTDSGRYIQDEIVIENLSIWQDSSVPATAGAAIDVVEGPATSQSLYLKIDNVIIEGTYHGVRHAAGVGGAIRNSNILKCVQNGVYVTGATSTTSMVFENTYCHLNGNFGYVIEKGAYVAFLGCASDSNTGGGYSINQTKGYALVGSGAEANTGPAIELINAGGGVISGCFTIANGAGTIQTTTSAMVTLIGGDFDGTGFAIRGISGNTPIQILGTTFRGDHATQRVNYTPNVLDLSANISGKLVGNGKNQWAIGAAQQAESDTCFAVTGTGDATTIYGQKVLHTFTGAGVARNASIYAQAVTAASAVTYPLIIGQFLPNAVQGAGSTITRSAGTYIQEQTRGNTANANIMIDAGQTTVPSGNWSIYDGSNRPSYHGGALTWKPSAAATPSANGDLTFEATSNTSLTVKFKGSDGTVRSAVITLA